MKITIVKETPIVETPHKLDVRKLYDTDSAQAMHITLQAGKALKPHITPVDVFFYILEGTPKVLVGDEKIEVKADCLVESPKDIVHCLYNNSTTVARILVIKAPRPTTQTKLL
ncbi:MAG: cupin domain-containing protein [Paludibacteraceae bacterium]|nr:cupin domain-containing protein [Paludibacteraceae bacterium]MBN2787691.1 cupin domain-containing protein [Paludibacteraceae bacterium]